MEDFNRQGINCIQYIQDTFEPYESALLSISQVGDPGYAFTVLFPIVASFNTYLAAEFLLVNLITEWSNTLLKWLLMEDRPYWWIRETDAYTKLTMPKLKQGALTCETGPGSPSGHVMGTAALLFVLVKFFVKLYNSRIISKSKKRCAKIIFWSIYAAFLVAVAISRLYVATHFPHQCVLGAVIGVLFASILTNNSWRVTTFLKQSNLKTLTVTTIAMSLASFGAYWLQKALGIDPQWSVRLAFKWCENPKHIHVNTTPLYSLVRDIGAATALALLSPIGDLSPISTAKSSGGAKRKGAAAQNAPSNVRNIESLTPEKQMIRVACVLFCCTVIYTTQPFIPTDNAFTFYACHFCLHVAQPILLLKVVPFIGNCQPNKIKQQ